MQFARTLPLIRNSYVVLKAEVGSLTSARSARKKTREQGLYCFVARGLTVLYYAYLHEMQIIIIILARDTRASCESTLSNVMIVSSDR